MGKGDTHHDTQADESGAHEPTSVFEEPATLREPAAPRVPRVITTSAVPVIPFAREGQSRRTHPQTLQEAREATDALLREILEEEPEDTAEPLLEASPEPSSEEDEDWPQELHPLHW